jgi:hypothetical protein
MLEKSRGNGRGDVQVTFRLPLDGHALPVHLAGEFNGWSEGDLELDAAGGELRATVPLPAGRRFEFRYRDANGRWFNDPAADDYVANEWGGMNGVVAT